MKRILYIFVIMLGIVSCTQDVSCEGYTEKELVKSILKDELLKRKVAFEMAGINNFEEFINDFFNNNVKLELIRTTAKNKELKSCNCEAQLKFYLKEEIQKKIDSTFKANKINKNDDGNEIVAKMFNDQLYKEFLAPDGIDIEYRLQMTSDDNVIAEVNIDIIDQLSRVVAGYYGLLKSYETENNKGKTLTFNNGSYKYTLKFIENDKVEIIYNGGEYSEKEIATYTNGKIYVDELPNDFPIKKDEFYILEGNTFKVYNPEIDAYDIYKK